MAELIDFFNDSSIPSVQKEARLAEMEAKLVPAIDEMKIKKVYDRVVKH